MTAETHVMGRKRAGELLHAALAILQANNGEMRGKQVLREIERRVKLSDYERERHEKSGYIRWESVVHFYSIDAVKAGFLRKHKGVWYLTPEGEKALKLSPKEFIDLATAKYREWKKRQDEQASEVTPDEAALEVVTPRGLAASQAIDQAKEEIADYVRALNEYEFQDLVAALHGLPYAIRGSEGPV